MKKIIAILLILTLVFSFAGCSKEEVPSQSDSRTYVGTITVALDSEAAPITVQNFIDLAKDGFYNGLTFHRIMKGFMMQGGDPKGDGTGGSKTQIKGEFLANGVNNTLSHKRGVISMARSGSVYEQYLAAGYKLSDLPEEAASDIERAMNSASSQFFIMHQDAPHLDGNYAAFGQVTQGMDIVDAICENAVNTDNNGSVPENKRPYIMSINIKKSGSTGIVYADIAVDYTAVMKK